MKLCSVMGRRHFLVLFLGLMSPAGFAHAQGQLPAMPSTGVPTPAAATAKTDVLIGEKEDINGKYKVSFSLPGPKGPGYKAEVILTLAVSGDALTGEITDPDNSAQLCNIYDSSVKGNQFSFSARSGKKVYQFTGTASKDKLLMTESTGEVFKLDAGSKVKTAKDTGVDGAYLVAVHSPGGAMDNIIILNTNGSALTGKMVRIGNPTGDWSDFSNGTVQGNKVSFYSKTPQSTFHFSGEVSGSTIQLDLEVIDDHFNVEGTRLAASTGQ
jgi:hypothetical protein